MTAQTAITLRPYQTDGLSAIEAACRRGIRRMLLSWPTGAGKTVLFTAMAGRREGRTLVLAHREELIDQAVNKFRMVKPDADIGVVKGERDEHDRAVVVASVPTLARPERRDRFRDGFETIIVDEAHHTAARTYVETLDHFQAFQPNGPLVLGVTATPVRGDGVGLSELYEEIVHEVPLADLIEQGYLSDIRAVQVKLATDFNKLHTRAGDYIDSETGEVLMAANAPAHVVGAWRINAQDRPTIVFTPTVALAEEMVSAFDAKGITAAVLSGETPAKERKATLELFRTGAIKVIANAALLTEGIDLPFVSCIVICKPTKSQAAYAQMVGRGFRRHPGKSDCLVIDVVGSTLDLELQTVATLTGLPLDTLNQRGATVRGVLQEQKAAGETTQKGVDGRLVVIPVDLLGSGANWIPTGTGRYVLAAGNQGSIVLVPSEDSWRVLHVHGGESGIPSTLADNVSLEWGQGVAEDYVRKWGASTLVDRSASWRNLEPTSGQLGMLRFLSIPKRSVKGMTRGEVSDLISAAKVSRQLAEVA